MSDKAATQRPIDDVPRDPVAEDAGRLVDASTGRLVAILAALVLLCEVVPFQYAMISVIVPKIGQTFPGAGDSVTWAVTIVGVGGGATMALVGKAADLYGKKRILVLASLVFLVGALICAVTTSWALFLVGRGLAAVSLGVSAIAYSLVRDLMPRRWIPIAVGLIGTGFGLAGVFAPVLCGALTDHFSWRSVFWFLVIYVGAAIPLFMLVVPESPVRVKQRFDVPGAVLFGLGVGGVLIYISQGTAWGWTDPGCVAYLLGGLVALAAFVAWERRVREPMMELSLLRAPRVSIVMAIWFLGAWVLTAVTLASAYMLQSPTSDDLKRQIVEGAAAQSNAPVSVMEQAVQFRGDVGYGAGFSVFEFALHVTIWTGIVSMIFGTVGGWAARKYGARLPLIVGMAILAVTSALLFVWHTTWQQQMAMGIVLGVGTGLYYATGPNLIMDAVPVERQGISSGMLGAFGSVGTATAPAVFTAIASAHPFQSVAALPDGGQVITDIPQVYTDAGYSQIFLIAGVIPAALGLVLALVLRSGRTPARGGESDN